MPDNIYQKSGLEPWGKIEPGRVYEVDSANTVPLFIGSPYYLVAGKMRGLPDAGGSTVDNAQAVKGAVTVLRNAAGKTVQNLPALTAGWGEGTWREDQEYVITVSDASYADADAGKMYNFTLESGTANANGYDGDARSKVQLLGSSENANTRNFLVTRRLSGAVRNAAGAIGCTVVGVINPANWQSGAA